MDDWGPTEHGLTISQCVKCQHWQKRGICAAFPGGVPVKILANEHDHTNPYPGDGGTVFQPKEG